MRESGIYAIFKVMKQVKQMLARTTDAKGRVVLGDRFANSTVLVEEYDNEIVIHLARVVPERELWLYKNKEALSQVREGLEQARNGESVPGPDMTKARRIAGLKED